MNPDELKVYFASQDMPETMQLYTGTRIANFRGLPIAQAQWEDNWDALFTMAYLVAEIGGALSKKLGYAYSKKLEADIRKYLSDLKATQRFTS